MWANSPWQGDYHDVQGELHDWINDGLITVFFFVVGLEIKRELVSGELREWRAAALPAIAALGGMLVPAAGIAGATAVATRMQIGQLPAGVGSCHILGAAALGGIGFTVSLFITGLAYATPRCRHRPRSASWPGRCPPRCSGR